MSHLIHLVVSLISGFSLHMHSLSLHNKLFVFHKLSVIMTFQFCIISNFSSLSLTCVFRDIKLCINLISAIAKSIQNRKYILVITFHMLQLFPCVEMPTFILGIMHIATLTYIIIQILHYYELQHNIAISLVFAILHMTSKRVYL